MYIHVRATPGAKKETFIETDTRRFSIAVKEPAKQNLANIRIRELIAEYFSVPLAKVVIVTGHKSPQKMLTVEGAY